MNEYHATTTPHGIRGFRSLTPPRVAAGAVVVVLLLYFPSLAGGFFFDDHRYVVDNADLEAIPLSQPWQIFSSRTNPWEYLPLRDLSYRLDMAMFGSEPLGYRIHNLVLYAACCWAVWWTCLQLTSIFLGDPDTRLAAIATALFAAHPAHVESVAWISGRKELLSGLFGILALGAFARCFVDNQYGRRWSVVAAALFAAAILSKVVVLPLVVGLVLLGFASRRSSRRVVLARAFPLVIIAALGLAMAVFTGHETGILGSTTVPEWRLARVGLALRILGRLHGIVAFPIGLRIVYDLDYPSWIRWASALGGFAAVVAGLIAVRRSRYLGWFGVALGGVLLIPFLQIVPFRTWTLVSDRFLFLPLLGFSLSGAALLRRWRYGRVAASVLFILLAVLTAIRAADWSDGARVVAGAARLSPRSRVAVGMHVTEVLLPRGEFGRAREEVVHLTDADAMVALIDAREHLARGDLQSAREDAIRLSGSYDSSDLSWLLEVGNLFLEVDMLEEAERAYRLGVKQAPGQAASHYNLGLVLKRQGRFVEAAEEIGTAIERGMNTPTTWNNLALCLRDSGRPQEAVEAFQAALNADAVEWHAAYNLARLLYSQERHAEALQALSEARSRAQAAGDSLAPIEELEAAMRR